ncbi:unnamed protein product [Paramecium primaurelia]|uniref:Transmembrane protein n=1 Tax=Paramecium primaurelia TaxID=5886 RepID=A0A8S1M9H9_PARPR|nr:unnamed protein product [Paramecium primaurelia]
MKFYHSQLSSKSFIAYHLLSITTGIFFILPLVFTQMQFIVCTITMGIFGICQCIIFSRFQKLQIYMYSFILSLSLLLSNTYTKALIIGTCLGLIINLQNQFTQILQFQFLQECQYFGLLLYYLLIKNISIQSISIFTFISSSIIRLLLCDYNIDLTNSKPQPLIIKQKQQYLSILGQFIIDLIFFGTLYLLYQFQNHLIIIALTLLLFASIIVNLFQNYLKQFTYPILIIQIIVIIQLIFIDVFILIPFDIIIIILFVCRPINDIYLKNNLGFEIYQQEHSNTLIISIISTIFAALLIY